MAQTKVKTKQTVNDGWVPIDGTFTYASATTINVSAGAASIYSVGDKIRYQNNDSGTYLYDYIVIIADTLLTVAGNTVPNATLTDAYYSKIATPLNFPHWFAYTPTITGNGGGTAPTYSSNTSYFYMLGRVITTVIILSNASGGTAGSGTNILLATWPVGSPGSVAPGVGRIYESGGTQGIIYGIYWDATNMFFRLSNDTNITLNDQSSAARDLVCTINARY